MAAHVFYTIFLFLSNLVIKFLRVVVFLEFFYSIPFYLTIFFISSVTFGNAEPIFLVVFGWLGITRV